MVHAIPTSLFSYHAPKLTMLRKFFTFSGHSPSDLSQLKGYNIGLYDSSVCCRRGKQSGLILAALL
jgi:hypothetical protein